MRYLCILFFFSLFINCSFPEKKGIKFEILNSTKKKIEEVDIYINEKCYQSYKNINPNEKVKGFLSMDCESFLSEGSYNLKVKMDTNIIFYGGGGYFVNNKPFFDECKLKFNIKNDTILFSVKKCNFILF